jgi:FtsH-binding integral membrane protein
MVDYRQASYGTPARAGDASLDLGLRRHMIGVYNYMTLGLLVTAAAAYGIYAASFVEAGGRIVGVTALGDTLFNSPLMWVVMLAPLAFVLVLSFGINKLSAGTMQVIFWAFAAAMGISLSSIFAVYEMGSIVRVFLITAASFGALSLYGYTTKRDLTGWGSFLLMGLVGLIIASIVNMIWPSGVLGFAIPVIGVLIFAGLTAYDTQKIKESYYEADDSETTGKKQIMGALSLYLDFINLFMMLLRLVGSARQ